MSLASFTALALLLFAFWVLTEDVSKRCGHALPEFCSLSLHFLRMQRSV